MTGIRPTVALVACLKGDASGRGEIYPKIIYNKNHMQEEDQWDQAYLSA